MTGPESIASCSWEARVAELGDPFTDRDPASVRRPYSPPPVPPRPTPAGPVTTEIPVVPR